MSDDEKDGKYGIENWSEFKFYNKHYTGRTSELSFTNGGDLTDTVARFASFLEGSSFEKDFIAEAMIEWVYNNVL